MKEDAILMYKDKVYVPNSGELKNVVKEMHNVPYAGNPIYHKIIAAVRSQYFWPGNEERSG
jgi:hypothetical protein